MKDYKIKDINIFLDIEKEIRWLNDMSEKGYRLVDRKGIEYFFEECESGKYQYQVERRSFKSTQEDEEYVDFLSNLNISKVTSQLGWYYFEKENDGKEFKIYSDIPSKIKHYKKQIRALSLIGVLSLYIVIENLNSSSGPSGPYIINIPFPLVANSLIVLVIVFAVIKYCIRINILKKEESNIE